jgi:hypothetical protein
MIEKYCKSINPAVISSAIQRKGYSIIEELKQLLLKIAEHYKKKITYSSIYFTIIINIIIRLGKVNPDVVQHTSIDLSSYQDLYDFLKSYFLREGGIELDKISGNRILSNLENIIINTSSEKDLINWR